MTHPEPAPVTLALDTATPFLTLALAWAGGERAVSREVGRAHAEELPGAARALFEQAGLPFRAQTIVIGTGPGSYTGVRVGASYALGLASVWGARVLGVCTLEALVRGDGPQGVSLDARKGNVYSAVYGVQGGVVTSALHAPARRPLDEFGGLLGGLPHHHDLAPAGLALLRAGLAHGAPDWALAYL
ncbi:tRNA (adenosine(37)-N6)-threonylcarbamoyltransferase complex dimerization subunit type 1 TsaB [Deinococcus koreensis]|uniref:tRNA (Adenosine(37)-N6)-threonylcarbamoyltransferase complex dimerization subunit type 1 TsaB n=1 Tax=Deinococcus koreensis TaxID=2054903 RepID=A0A2K3UXH1_9DEIO|nr:tRNA (adenosine(37)-N6)-threonylcarbamoyltransferase complex dimerization subunit type 1 TsaB [Deinococcus koreensis]PNY81229.1 tRNA (adenosine(37)-N6)-threonylcarbamoyltransferase complex dimerization subunit type 1 TsaB [Deinococcus koreensis]